MHGFHVRSLTAVSLAMSMLIAGCAQEAQPAAEPAPPAEDGDTAAAPAAVRENDPGAAPIERAAPPTLEPVVLGEFEASGPEAKAATGSLTIEDTLISGENGTGFVTERVALVSGDDHYGPSARYAEAMMIEPHQQVELREVVEVTRSSETPGDGFCGTVDTGYIALAKVMQGETEVVKLIALSGTELPAESATGVKLCGVAEYRSAEA